MKRILTLGDMHCGHDAGLTPPRWQYTPKKCREASNIHTRTKREKFAAAQRESWKWYIRNVKKHGPYDVVVCNGDAIDGRGDRSGGTELVEADRHDQVTMAETCLQQAMGVGTKLVMTFGTAYHTGQEEDFESLIASDLNAEKIGAHEWIKTEGVVFDIKHHIGSSGVPHGRHTAIARESLWADLWAERGLVPKHDVLIRSHVHYFQFCGDGRNLRMTLPALQTMGSKYGARRCSGLVDFGFVVFEAQRGDYTWHPCLADLKTQHAKAVTV